MTTRKIAIGAAVAAVVILLAWFVFLWRPQSAALDAAADREAVAANTNAELELRVQRLRAAQADAPALRARVEALQVAVPEEPELAEFILAADTAATESGVDFLTISPTPPTPSADPALPSTVDLAITVDGGYFQVLDYLNRLSVMDRLVVIDTLSLAAASAEPGFTDISVSLSAKVFTTAPPEALPGETVTPGTAPPVAGAPDPSAPEQDTSVEEAP